MQDTPSGRVKHLNPRQGITTFFTKTLPAMVCLRCETPKSPPGDYNFNPVISPSEAWNPECETPKSPPGDYNLRAGERSNARPPVDVSVKHLNPRQGIATYDGTVANCRTDVSKRVKHLNPRQGITTLTVSNTQSSYFLI